MNGAADELEAIRQLKARYCRFLDTKDFESWRGLFTRDVVVTRPDDGTSFKGPRSSRQLRSDGDGRPEYRPHLGHQGNHLADQDPASDPNHPEGER
jgi:ketosteroid isomerase-like protein